VPTGRGTGDIEYAAQDFCVKLALRDTTYKAHIGPLRVAKKVIQRCRSKPIEGHSPNSWAADDNTRKSNFEVRQLVLFGAAAIVLLVFAWTFVL